MDAVGHAFFSDFMPIVSGLAKGSVHVPTTFTKSASTWTDLRDAATGKEVFSVPPALDSSSPDPVSMAEAITACWEPGPATDAMRPVLAKLLDVGRKFPEPAEKGLEERVTHTMYVMY